MIPWNSLIDESKHPAISQERRRQVRYRCGPFVSCQLAPGRSPSAYWARLVNLSADGAGLLATVPLAPGAVVRITVARMDNEAARVLTARAVHVTPATARAYFAGFGFVEPLTPEELYALVLASFGG